MRCLSCNLGECSEESMYKVHCLHGHIGFYNIGNTDPRNTNPPKTRTERRNNVFWSSAVERLKNILSLTETLAVIELQFSITSQKLMYRLMTAFGLKFLR